MEKYYKADADQKRPWARFVGMLGAFLLPEYIRHAMSPADRVLMLNDLLSATPPPQNGTERGERLAALALEKSDFSVRAELLTLAASAEGEKAICGYLGLVETPLSEVVEYNQYIDDEHNPARVADAARPAAVKAAHVRALFSAPPAAPFGAPPRLAPTKGGGKRSK